MKTLPHLFAAFLTWICLTLSPALHAAEPMSENAKIESLISHIESLNDATFIRNGSDYTAKNAAKFLRGKWDANKKEIHSANDFISKAATKSSTTGKPYVIRLKGGVETPCADYLNAQLKKIETK